MDNHKRKRSEDDVWYYIDSNGSFPDDIESIISIIDISYERNLPFLIIDVLKYSDIKYLGLLLENNIKPFKFNRNPVSNLSHANNSDKIVSYEFIDEFCSFLFGTEIENERQMMILKAKLNNDAIVHFNLNNLFMLKFLFTLDYKLNIEVSDILYFHINDQQHILNNLTELGINIKIRTENNEVIRVKRHIAKSDEPIRFRHMSFSLFSNFTGIIEH